MLYNNNISILRKPAYIEEEPPPPPDYFLYFRGDGYIAIDDLAQFLDHREDFELSIEFDVKEFNPEGNSWLWNSCIAAEDNKIGVAVDGTNLYVQIDKGSGDKFELYIPFSETNKWITLTVRNDREELSAILKDDPLVINEEPLLHLPESLGFKIASNTTPSEGLNGSVDNILLTDLREPIAQYPLITGEGTVAKDVVGHYDGNIVNGIWSI